MRVLETPQPWIAAALALIAVAAVLLVVGRRRAARAAPPVPATPEVSPAPSAPSAPSAPGPVGAGSARHRAVPRPAPSPVRTGRSEADRRPSRGGPTTRMLHGGAAPSQVAAVLGVDEDALAHLVAAELGLFASRAQGAGRGTKRTVEPGRAWAMAGSASSSTTPTTG